MRSTLLTLVVALSLSAVLAADVKAIPIEWNAPAGGAFDDPNNWSPATVPNLMDDAFFGLPATYAVTFLNSAASQTISVTDGDVTFSLNGFSYDMSDAEIGNLGPSASLTVNSGALMATGSVLVNEGGVLQGNGTVNSTEFTIGGGGALRGSLLYFGAPVVNAGFVSPGNDSIDTLTLDSGLQNLAGGTLEIEIAGNTTPGMDHDFLLIGLTAVIDGGHLRAPIQGGYVPAIGHSINFLQANGGVNGQFDAISLPGFETPGVAAQFNITPTGGALDFVAQSIVTYIPNPVPSEWGDPNTWVGGVPTTTSVVGMSSAAAFPTRVDLNVATQASRNAFAHQVNLSSNLAPAPITLGIPEGTSLSAIDRVNVGENGILEVFGGTVYSNVVQVESGGQLLGSGTLEADVVLGTGMGTGDAVLAVGNPGSAAGTMHIGGDLSIGSEGVINVAVEDAFNFGQIVVDGTASLGGRLVIDISSLDPNTPVGTRLDIVLAGSFEQGFDSIETIGGNGTVFFAPATQPPMLGECGLAALVVCEGNGAIELHLMGDMNLDGEVDEDDAPDFVEGLLDRNLYKDNHCFLFPTYSGDYSGDGTFDFDDIDYYLADLETFSAADLQKLIAEFSVPEPATGALLLSACLVLGFSRGRLAQTRGVLGERVDRC